MDEQDENAIDLEVVVTLEDIVQEAIEFISDTCSFIHKKDVEKWGGGVMDTLVEINELYEHNPEQALNLTRHSLWGYEMFLKESNWKKYDIRKGFLMHIIGFYSEVEQHISEAIEFDRSLGYFSG